MAEILNLEIKSDIKPVIQDIDSLTGSLSLAQQSAAELTLQISIQEGVLLKLKGELISLKATQDSIPKGAWYAGQAGLTEKIKNLTNEIAAETNALADLNNQQKDNNIELQNTESSIEAVTAANKKGTPISRLAAAAVRGIGTALKAMGIGLVVAALLLLRKAFMSNEKVMKAVSKVTNIVSNLFSDIVDVFVDTYKWVKASSERFDAMKTVMEDLVTVALLPMKLAFYGIQLGAENLMLAWYQLQEAFGKEGASESVKELQGSIAFLKAELGGVAVEAVGAVKSIYINAGEAVNELGKIVKVGVGKTSKIKIDSTKRTNKAINTLNRDNQKETEAERLAREQEADEKSREAWRARMLAQIKEHDKLVLEGLESLKALQAENAFALIEGEKAQALESLKIQYDKDLLALEQYDNFLDLKKERDIQYLREKGEVEDEAAAQQKEKDKELADFKADLMMQGLAVIGQGLEVQAAVIEKNYKKEIKLAEANGKSTEGIEAKFEDKRKKNAKKQKALKIGLAVIDTYQGAIAAYANGLAVGGPAGLVLAPIAAGLAVAAGLANIAMITQTDVGGGGGGGGATAGGGGGTPAPEMMSGAFELSGGEEPEPLQAYVVSDDITDSQNGLAIIRRRATI